jgi:uncharacterized membrane protein
MKNRPRVKVVPSRADKVMEFFSWFLLILLWLIPILSYSNLPETIPAHYSVTGDVDKWGTRMSIYVLPIVGTVLFILLTVVNRYPHIFTFPIKITHENAPRQYKVATELMRCMKSALLVVFILVVVFTIRTARGETAGLGFWFIPITLVLLFILTVIFVVRMHKGR